MRNEPVQIVCRGARGFECLFNHVGDHADGVFEHFTAFHAQMTDRARC